MFDPAPEFTELITAIRQTKYLEKALRFLESQSFPLNLMELVQQDEFSHDMILPFPDHQNFLVLFIT